MPPLVRFPSGPITPHGAYHILHDRIPQFGLNSFGSTCVFNMMGGLAIADKIAAPGRVEVIDMKGLMPPWRTIDQKGATQDGVTFVDALYDRAEVQLNVRVVGKDPADCRRVGRYLMDSLDVKRESELWWFTHKLGRWWAPVRWLKVPDDPIGGIKNKTQNIWLRLGIDMAFWQSYPSVDQFMFGYATAKDDFDVDDPDDLGTGWTVSVTGPGTGNLRVESGQVSSSLLNDRTAVARKVGYTSSTNNQVVDVQIGTFFQWWFPIHAYTDIWGRMANIGTPGASGVRLRIMRHKLLLSFFVGGVETVLRERILIIPPVQGETFRLVLGEEGDERRFKVLRGGSTLINMKESGTASPLGASNRSAGLGSAAPLGEYPAGMRYWGAGDNSTVTQSGFLSRFNVGDQDAWDNYTCFGPGTFRFWNGPNAGANEYVEFGPLLPNQIMQIRTDPRKRGVIDMTSIPPSPQQLNFLQQALKDFLNFATGNNSTPLATEIESFFGVTPPQGNPYSLMHGRFSKPIPAKSPGKVAEKYSIKVSIDNGNADSKIIAALTPLRRMPF